MHFSISDILSLLILATITGTIAGIISTFKKRGFGWMLNLTTGLAGAIIGSAVVRFLKINFGIGQITLRWEDLVASIIVALLLIVTISYIRNKRSKKKK